MVSDSNGEKNRDKAAPMCPACGSRLTRRSMRRTWKDRFKSAFGLWPYRCQMCNTRFTGPQDPESIARHNASTEEDLREREEDARLHDEQKKDLDDASGEPDKK